MKMQDCQHLAIHLRKNVAYVFPRSHHVWNQGEKFWDLDGAVLLEMAFPVCQ